MSHSNALEAATLDTLPLTVAVLDESGEFLLTNRSWRAFGSAAGRDDPDDVGVDYVAATAGADDDHAREAADGLRTVLEGERESFALEYPCHSPDERRWFLMRASRFVVDGRTRISVVHLDITDRKLAELDAEAAAEEARREREGLAHVLERIDGLVRDVTDAAVDARSRSELERRVCERVVQTEPYVLAWIGRLDVSGERLRPREWASDEGVPLEDDEVRLDDDEAHPAARAIRTGDPVVVEVAGPDGGTDPRWPAGAGDRFRSVAALPLAYGEVTYGVLAVFASTPDAFDERELAVLESLTGTVSTAMNAIEARRLLSTDTVVELELSIDDRSLFLADLSARFDAAFDYRGLTYAEDGAAVLFFGVDAGAEIVDAAAGYEDVRKCTLVAEREDALLLEVTVEAGLPIDLAEQGAVVRRLDAADGVVDLRLDCSDGRSARAVFDAVSERYGAVELVRYHEDERVARTPRDVAERIEGALTDRQLTALRKAYHAGYYAWPRRVSGEELAASMDISRSTFHQHLRTAERRVLDELFEGRPGGGPAPAGNPPS